jgi:hypothetical protein
MAGPPPTARRVAQWRAQYYDDECALILSDDDFRATAFGGGFIRKQ